MQKMSRKEFVETFECLWDDNSGLPHNEEQLELAWQLMLDTLTEDGEKVDYRWRPTQKERAKWIVPRYLEEERYDD